MMKKQLILLVVSAFVLGVSLSASPAFAGHQPGFSLVVMPTIHFPVVYQRAVYSEPFIPVYSYDQYPLRPVKVVRVVNDRPNHQLTHIKHVEPVRINKYRGSYVRYKHW